MQSKEKKYFRNNFIFILIFIFFFLCFSKIKFFFNSSTKEKNTPEFFLYSINNGIENSFDFFSGIGDYFTSKKRLLKQVEELQNEIERQKYYSIIDSSTSSLFEAGIQDLSSKNISNKNKSILDKDLPVIAKKIFSDFTSIYDTVLLDKGFSSGVKKGDIVFFYPNLLIGQIDTINPNTSLVVLYSKDKNKIEGVIKVSKNSNKKTEMDNSSSSIQNSSSSKNIILLQDRFINTSNVLIDLYGNGGGDFIATLPGNLEVSTGTIIYLSNDESKALGEVVKVEKQDASFYETVLIKGYYNTRSNDDYYIMHK